MNNTGKIVIGIIVVIILAAGAYYWYSTRSGNGTPSTSSVFKNGVGSVSGNTAAGGANGSTGSAGSAALPGGTSNSDAALNQDTAAIDAQMNGLSTDNANTNTSLNDQPISQQ